MAQPMWILGTVSGRCLDGGPPVAEWSGASRVWSRCWLVDCVRLHVCVCVRKRERKKEKEREEKKRMKTEEEEEKKKRRRRRGEEDTHTHTDSPMADHRQRLQVDEQSPSPEPLFSASDLEELRGEVRSREREIDGSTHEGVVPVEYVLSVCVCVCVCAVS